MVNGLPGPMALETAKACLNRGFHVVPHAFTGRSYDKSDYLIEGILFFSLLFNVL